MVDTGKLDDRLIDLALGRRGGSASVLVEPDLPRPRVELAPGGAGSGRRRPIGIASPGDPAAAKRVVDDLRRLLTELAGSEPRWLEAARVFVVELDGSALATLAASPLVRRIHPNTERRGI